MYSVLKLDEDAPKWLCDTDLGNLTHSCTYLLLLYSQISKVLEVYTYLWQTFYKTIHGPDSNCMYSHVKKVGTS